MGINNKGRDCQNMLTRRYLVSGHVQGVGFRRFVQKQGEAMGLSGMVRNLVDGRVEILAKGSETELGEFAKVVAKGPSASRVTSVEVDDVIRGPSLEVEGFGVLENGEKPWFIE